jgi:hypothetical protein
MYSKNSKETIGKGHKCGICDNAWKDLSAFCDHIIKDHANHDHKKASSYMRVFKCFKYGTSRRLNESLFVFNVHKAIKNAHKVFSIPFELCMQYLTSSEVEIFKTELRCALERIKGCAYSSLSTEKSLNINFAKKSDLTAFLNDIQ